MGSFFIRQRVISMWVDAATFGAASSLVSKWIDDPKGRYICVSNVHMCMECLDNAAFADVVNNADLVVPDGKPIALALKLLGQEPVEQIRGADLTEEILKYSHFTNAVVGFYGGTATALARIRENLNRDYPGIKIGCMISPPFRALSEVELADDRKLINDSGIQLLFVGLGCPKQERWMAANVKHLNATLLGVGAVFDFLSDEKPMAPKWISAIGMEWFFRLISEPHRLWKRYATTNPKFIWYFGKQYIRHLLHENWH